MLKVKSIPFPYQAMLSVCSDLDETANAATYFDTMRFLNTAESTQHGPGVDLEVGNSLYFDMPSDQFSYFNTDEVGRRKLHQLIRSGHIDCIHSFGDHTQARSRIKEILAELEAYDSYMRVWIDHAVAPTNLDDGIMQGQGNQPDAPAYHADLISAYGIRYVWLGRVTSIIGQDVKRRLAGIWNAACPVQSSITLAKEWLKGWLPKFGKPKYQMHVDNKILRPIHLANGSQVWEFLRCNPSPWGVSEHETGDGFGQVVTKPFLKKLVQRGGKSIIYTHLGKLSRADNSFNDETIHAWQLLKSFSEDKDVLVCTTRRLLDYTLMTETIRVHQSEDNGEIQIRIENPQQLPLDGLSIECGEQQRKISLILDKEPFLDFESNIDNGKTVITIPWQPLSFPVAL